MRIVNLIASIVIPTFALAGAAAAQSETIAEHLDAIVPKLTEQSLATLGGPESASEIVAQVSGRWFALENVVRNWDRDGPAMLERSMDSQCADDWENIVTHVAAGPEAFEVRQTAPDGSDNGSFLLTGVGGRDFQISFDEIAMLEAMGAGDAAPEEQAKMREELATLAAKPVPVWMPYPDIFVSRGPFEIDVYARCPG